MSADLARAAQRLGLTAADMAEQVRLSNEITEEVLAEERTDIARTEGRGQAIALATRAICPYCADAEQSPAEPMGSSWIHRLTIPVPCDKVPCDARPIWEAIKAEGWL